MDVVLIVDKSRREVGKGSNGEIVGRRYHCALWRDYSTS